MGGDHKGRGEGGSLLALVMTRIHRWLRVRGSFPGGGQRGGPAPFPRGFPPRWPGWLWAGGARCGPGGRGCSVGGSAPGDDRSEEGDSPLFLAASR